ncbi:MAG: glycosyltransferase family 39 protein, partial [Deltaproteobacteria bacterium]|nr:glycosyltransferase family 39 protein [Deltaproteobacteria bacterium]
MSLFLDIHPDMADHWVWSRFLDFGYFEHPPMVAYTMKLATLIGGNNFLALKIGSILFSVLILYLSYWLGIVFFDRKTALVLVLILEATPYFSGASVFWHIDQPYMVFWLLGLITMGYYFKSQDPNLLILLGLISGFGAVSKYIMILFPVGFLIWCFWTKQTKFIFTRWQTYLGAVLALLILLPNIYWNYQHEWVTFTYNFKKGLMGASFGKHFLIFIFSQFMLFSPVLSILFWYRLFSKKLNTDIFPENNFPIIKWRFLIIMGLVPIVFFSLTSFLGKGSDPHWVNVAYFSLFLLLSKFIFNQVEKNKSKSIVKLFSFAYGINYLLIIFVLIQIYSNIVPVQHTKSPFNKVIGWDMTARQIEDVFNRHFIKVPKYLITREYQLSGVLSLYLINQPIPHSIEKPTRNQWSPSKEVLLSGAAIVCPLDEC